MVMENEIILNKGDTIMNKKGRCINTVEISKGRVTAFDDDGHLFKLNRNQRNLFKGELYTDECELMRVFGNPNILSDQFRLVIDGDVVYHA